MRVSIIIPCFNEKNTVEALLDNVNQDSLFDKEIIVIDDFSTDGTREILKKINNKYTKLILNESNSGKGYCIQRGIKEANGDIILIQDADLEYDPSEFENFIKIFQKYNADIIFGSRMRYKDFSRSHNFLNLVGYNPDLARYLPSLFGSLSFFMIGLITFQEKKDNTFLLSTFFACSSIYLIKYSQELRPYSLLFFSSALNIFFYIKMLRVSEKKNIHVFLFILFSVINYSVNPFSLIIYFSQITYLIYRFLFFREKAA